MRHVNLLAFAKTVTHNRLFSPVISYVNYKNSKGIKISIFVTFSIIFEISIPYRVSTHNDESNQVMIC